MKSSEMNLEIRETMRKKRIYAYEVANELGINPVSFGRWMQRELTPEKKAIVMAAIEKAAQ